MLTNNNRTHRNFALCGSKCSLRIGKLHPVFIAQLCFGHVRLKSHHTVLARHPSFQYWSPEGLQTKYLLSSYLHPFSMQEKGLYPPDARVPPQRNHDDGFSSQKSGFPVQKFHSRNVPVYPIARATRSMQLWLVNLFADFHWLDATSHCAHH